MAKRWTAISIPIEIYEKATEYYDKHQEELKLKHGVRSLTAFIYYCIREYLKQQQAL